VLRFWCFGGSAKPCALGPTINEGLETKRGQNAKWRISAPNLMPAKLGDGDTRGEKGFLPTSVEPQIGGHGTGSEFPLRIFICIHYRREDRATKRINYLPRLYCLRIFNVCGRGGVIARHFLSTSYLLTLWQCHLRVVYRHS
jgi:hypothetical protein